MSTYRRCPHCHEVRSDVRRRPRLVDGGALCDDCSRVFGTPTRETLEAREMAEHGRSRVEDRINAVLALAGDR